MTPRHRRRLGVIVGLALLLPLSGWPPVSAAPIDDLRAEAARIQDRLEAQAEQVSILAERYNRARVELTGLEESLAKVEADVARSDERLQLVKNRLVQAAIAAYVHGGSSSLLSSMARGGPGHEMILRQHYLRVAAGDQRAIIGELRLAREDLALRRGELEVERKAAQEASDEASAASREAEAAEAEQRALLAQVDGEISALVAEEAARREAEDATRRRQAAVLPPASGRPSGDLPATRILPATGKGDIAVQEAMRHLGKPYVYGGSGPDVFDCSGLTAYAWRAAGVRLSHAADIQYHESTRVPVDQVIPGDLLFFGRSVEGIHHVAMYIGDGQMIEASTTGTPVRIRGWRSGDLVGAGRPG